jgi:hypothetical protein
MPASGGAESETGGLRRGGGVWPASIARNSDCVQICSGARGAVVWNIDAAEDGVCGERREDDVGVIAVEAVSRVRAEKETYDDSVMSMPEEGKSQSDRGDEGRCGLAGDWVGGASQAMVSAGVALSIALFPVTGRASLPGGSCAISGSLSLLPLICRIWAGVIGTCSGASSPVS